MQVQVASVDGRAGSGFERILVEPIAHNAAALFQQWAL
jgi:hypothetical protein